MVLILASTVNMGHYSFLYAPHQAKIAMHLLSDLYVFVDYVTYF